MRRSLIVTGLLMACAALTACRPPRNGDSPTSRADLRTDSAEYGVRFDGRMYRTDIGYTFTNHSRSPVSQNYCGRPQPPLLEKEVGPGRWLRAYSPFYTLCLTLPPFQVAREATYRSVLHVVAAPRGGRISPTWDVDSISGTYRLSWTLHASANPDDSAMTITATSPPFELRAPNAAPSPKKSP